MNHIYAELIEHVDTKNHLRLQAELTHRMRVDHIFEEVFPEYVLNARKPVEDRQKMDTILGSPESLECYQKMVQTYMKSCGRRDGGAAPSEESIGQKETPIAQSMEADEYAFKWYGAFANQCLKSQENAGVIEKIEKACEH